VPSPRVLIVVGAVLNAPWYDMIREGQAQTWIPEADAAGFAVRQSHGKRLSKVGQWLDTQHERLRWTPRTQGVLSSVDNVFGKPFRRAIQRVHKGHFADTGLVSWQQSIPDFYALQRWKVVASCKTALEEEFDLLYFTTASSYINIPRMVELVRSLPTSRLYAGSAMTEGVTGEIFASGASRFLSRDLVKFVVENRDLYANDVMEDVGLGRMARNFGLSLTPLPSMNIASLEELHGVSDHDLQSNFHFRLKSGTADQRNDVAIMKELHLRLQGSTSGGASV
jgi:hypothetical protein